MTTLRPGDDWDDDRLAAAFAARAERAPASPAGIDNDVLARVSTVDRAGPPRMRLALVAAVAVLAVAVGGSSILEQLGPGPTGPPDPSGVPASGPPPSAAPTTDPVLQALGDPITVSAALEVRDFERGDREIVVDAFLSSLPPCAPDPSEATEPNDPNEPTQEGCFEVRRWVMEQPEVLSVGHNAPDGPAFRPSLGLVPDPVAPPPGEPAGSPVAVVLVGHFHDRRYGLLPACEGNREACAEIFTVDRVLSIDGVEQAVAPERVVGRTRPTWSRTSKGSSRQLPRT